MQNLASPLHWPTDTRYHRMKCQWILALSAEESLGFEKSDYRHTVNALPQDEATDLDSRPTNG